MKINLKIIFIWAKSMTMEKVKKTPLTKLSRALLLYDHYTQQIQSCNI